MRATDILKNEHRVIERVVDCLEVMANRAQEDGRLDGESARQALDFFENFADRCHHGKEEKQLFPLLEARGRLFGPTEVMRNEHNLGRIYLQAMAAVLDGAAKGDSNALAQFAHQANLYVQMLREHIWKEDNRLFEMADMVLSSEDQQRLGEAFSAVESHDMPVGSHDKYLRLANELANRFQVSDPSLATGQSRGCFHFGH